jgi:LytS/YehU family sensor histidine kinase
MLYVSSQASGVSGPPLYNIFLKILVYVLIPSIISFYGSYFLLFRLFVEKVSKFKFLLFAIALLTMSSLIAALNIFSSIDSVNVLFEVTIMSFLLNSFNALIGFILHSFTSWFTDLKEKEALTEKTKLLELEMLKLKLDPHFLFNTINNIDVLLETDSDKAADYIIKLSSILRFYLYKTADSLINLSDEVKYIQEYIDLQKIRTSNEDFVKLSISGDPESKKIAPMIFIPFIENAFKHSQNKKANTIEIKLTILTTEVHFQCKNPINKTISEENSVKGIGDDLIKSRLNLIYGNRYQLDVNSKGDDYVIDLKVPI